MRCFGPCSKNVGQQVHPVFHISLLKKCVGPQYLPSTTLPVLAVLDDQDYCPLRPIAILQRRLILRDQKEVTQWLIHWDGLTSDEASWEDQSFIQ